MGTIFISYRRSDSAGHSGRLFDSLSLRFGNNQVFRDLEDIVPGADFKEALIEALRTTDAMLVVIGPEWLSTAGEHGRRLDDKEDLVRIEVSSAIERDDVHVIPVLVGGAPMPTESELPDVLKKLAGRNLFELSEMRWEYDVSRLGDSLANFLGIVERPRFTDNQSLGKVFRTVGVYLLLLALTAISVYIGLEIDFRHWSWFVFLVFLPLFFLVLMLRHYRRRKEKNKIV